MCLAVWALWLCPALPPALNRAWFRPGDQKGLVALLRVGVCSVFVVHSTPTSGRRPSHSLDSARLVKEMTSGLKTGAAAKHPCVLLRPGVDPALHVLSYLGKTASKSRRSQKAVNVNRGCVSALMATRTLVADGLPSTSRRDNRTSPRCSNGSLVDKVGQAFLCAKMMKHPLDQGGTKLVGSPDAAQGRITSIAQTDVPCSFCPGLHGSSVVSVMRSSSHHHDCAVLRGLLIA
jgi:hypothetical protein